MYTRHDDPLKAFFMRGLRAQNAVDQEIARFLKPDPPQHDPEAPTRVQCVWCRREARTAPPCCDQRRALKLNASSEGPALVPTALELCGRARHAAIKADDVRWGTETTAVGVQRDEDGDVIELRNCTACGSTLGRVVR